jgi:HEAT repeat protein
MGFGEKSEELVPVLAKIATHDGDASPRAKAVMALGMMGIRRTDVQRVVKALGTCVAHDSEAAIRYLAAKALIRLGPDAREVVGDLAVGVGIGRTFELREMCIRAIMAAGVDPKKGPETRVTDALLTRLTVPGEAALVRLEAVIALGALGRPQNPGKYTQVISALKKFERHPSKALRIWSHVSLMALDEKVDDKYLKIIAGFLGDTEADTRVQAINAMGALRSKSHAYLSDILKILDKDKDMSVMEASCNALGRMGDKSDKVKKSLIKCTTLDSEETIPVVLAACQGLAQLRVNSPDVMKALNNVLDHKALSSMHKNVVKDAIKLINTPKDEEDEPKKDDKPKVNAPKRGLGR